MSTDSAPALTLERFPEKVSVVRLGPGAEVPGWAESSSVFSVTATATETSIVCASRSVPTKTPSHGPLTAFVVNAPREPGTTGILHLLLEPVAELAIGVFALSTFGADWILVPLDRAEDAEQAWRRRGHSVAAAVPVDPTRKGKK